MLTQKQHQLLIFIDKRLKETGVSPSYDEMKEALKLKSKSGIHRLIAALEERGFLRHLPFRARALEVLKLPEVDIKSTSNIIASTFQSDSVEQVIPLYGKIAAGTPIEAIRDPEANVSVPSSMLGRGEHYALTVEGDSMINAGILDGDTVIIERTDNAENGQIVVALVDGFEVTLKRLRRQGSSIALEPENPAYQTRILPASRVAVQGRLIGLMRNY